MDWILGKFTEMIIYENILRRKCIYCNNKRMKNQTVCKECHTKYMREWRKTYKLNKDQKKKDICRSYANTYKQRGKLKIGLCLICGSEKAEMHHEDYEKPLEIIWLCRKCHLEYHKFTRETFKINREC